MAECHQSGAIFLKWVDPLDIYPNDISTDLTVDFGSFVMVSRHKEDEHYGRENEEPLTT